MKLKPKKIARVFLIALIVIGGLALVITPILVNFLQ